MEKDGKSLIVWLHYVPTEDIYDVVYTPVYEDSMSRLRMTPITLDRFPIDDDHIMDHSIAKMEKSERMIKEL